MWKNVIKKVHIFKITYDNNSFIVKTSKLAKSLGMNQANKNVLKILENKSLIEFVFDKTNHRYIAIKLTENGLVAVKEILKKRCIEYMKKFEFYWNIKPKREKFSKSIDIILRELLDLVLKELKKSGLIKINNENEISLTSKGIEYIN